MPTWTSPFDPDDTSEGTVSLTRTPRSSMASINLTRDGTRFGTYLVDHQVLLVDREENRRAGVWALDAAGFPTRAAIRDPEPSEPLLRMRISGRGGKGRWGDALIFEGLFPSPRPSAGLGIYFIGRSALFAVSKVLLAGLTRQLELLGLEVKQTGTDGVPEVALAWDERTWGWHPALNGPYDLAPGEEASRLVMRGLRAEAAATVPMEVAAAVNEVLRIPIMDPFDQVDSSRRGSELGILDSDKLLKLRGWARTTEATLPSGWHAHWERAIDMSAPHAPCLTALHLHDFYPDWWTSLPVEGVREANHRQLLGSWYDHPSWILNDPTHVEDARLSAAVALIVTHIADLDWLGSASRQKHTCWLCGQDYELGMLSAGRIAQLGTARVCHLCANIAAGAPPVTSSPVFEAGAVAAVREVVRLAGRIISASMVNGLVMDGKTTPETLILLRHALPEASDRGWGSWLAKAGVLGDGWRPSRGYINIAADGHECRSLFERIIDDYFSAHGIAHEPEPHYPFDAELNPHGARADWRLADGRFIEAAGMMYTSEYADKMARKIALAERHGIDLLVLTDADLPRLATLLHSD